METNKYKQKLLLISRLVLLLILLSLIHGCKLGLRKLRAPFQLARTGRQDQTFPKPVSAFIRKMPIGHLQMTIPAGQARPVQSSPVQWANVLGIELEATSVQERESKRIVAGEMKETSKGTTR